MSFIRMINNDLMRISTSSIVPQLAILNEPLRTTDQAESCYTSFHTNSCVPNTFTKLEPPYTCRRRLLMFAAELERKKIQNTSQASVYGDFPDSSIVVVNTPSGYVVNQDHLHVTITDCFPNLNRLINFLSNQMCEEEATRVRSLKFSNQPLSDEDIIYLWLNKLFSDTRRTHIIETLVDLLIARGPIGLVQDQEHKIKLRQKLSFIRYSGLDVGLDQQKLPSHAILCMSEAIVRICSTGFVKNFVQRALYRSKITSPSRADLLRIIVCLRDYADRLKPSRGAAIINREAILQAIEFIKSLIQSENELQSEVHMTPKGGIVRLF